MGMMDQATLTKDGASETRAVQPLTSSLSASLSALYTTHRPALVRMVTAITGDTDMAEDVCQDAFVSVLSGESDPACGDAGAPSLPHGAAAWRTGAERAPGSATGAALGLPCRGRPRRALDGPAAGGRAAGRFARPLADRARSPDARLLAHGDGVCAALYGGRCPCLSVFRPPHAPGALTRSGPARQAAAEPGALMPPGATADARHGANGSRATKKRMRIMI